MVIPHSVAIHAASTRTLGGLVDAAYNAIGAVQRRRGRNCNFTGLMISAEPAAVVLSGRKFVLACLLVAGLLLIAGRTIALPVLLLAAELAATILGLFLFSSFKYQVHKNALTYYGMLLVIVATFSGLPSSEWHQRCLEPR